MATRFLSSSFKPQGFPGPGQFKNLSFSKSDEKSSEPIPEYSNENNEKKILGYDFHDDSMKYGDREVQVEDKPKERKINNHKAFRKFDDEGEPVQRTEFEDEVIKSAESTIGPSFYEKYKYYLIGGGILGLVLLTGRAPPSQQPQTSNFEILLRGN